MAGQATLPMRFPDGLLRCSRCGQRKPPSDFAWHHRAKRQRDSYCRPCRSAYKKQHYAKNKQRYIDNAMALTQETRIQRTRWLIDYFAVHPCVDCGETDPIVLEFDHQRDKRFDVAGGITGRSWEEVLEEIEKCEVVCGNCHRRRTAKQFGFLRALLSVGANDE